MDNKEEKNSNMTTSENFKYIVYENDLKYRHERNIDPKRAIWNSSCTEKKFFGANHDDLDFRIRQFEKSTEKWLDLSNMKIYEIPKLDETIVKSVKFLFLSNNDFSDLLDLRKFTSLRVLDISHNSITELKVTPELEELVCNNNFFKTLPCIPNLKRLICHMNKLEIIPKYDKLEKLICNNNKLKLLNDYPKLKYLIIDDNPLTEIGNMHELTYFDLINTDIANIDANKIKNVVSINASNTKLRNFPVLQKLHTLEIMNTDINTLEYMQNLRYLKCNLGKITRMATEYNKEKLKGRIHKGKYVVVIFNDEQ